MNDFYYSVFLETCTRVLKIQVCSLFLIIVIPVLPSLALCTDFFFFFNQISSVSGNSDGKASACSSGDLGREDPWEKGMTTHSSILA